LVRKKAWKTETHKLWRPRWRVSTSLVQGKTDLENQRRILRMGSGNNTHGREMQEDHC
jgi:hypothetical protein